LGWRRLWSEPLLEVDTPFHKIARAGINPRLEKPVPIWFGGFSEIQQDRCARIGDGMLWTVSSSYSRRGNDVIRTRAQQVGRAPESIGFQASVSAKEGQSLEQALGVWKEAGGTHATVSPAGSDRRGAELLKVLPALRDEVAGAF
jgi:alkanesulfonate monooxygenase SsuD/methylene tetrahydromethanopterin reductase-like flavin-dependent oxidoreductase (luciferase family)